MGIIYKDGRLVRETDEEVAARMLAAAQRGGTEAANPQWDRMRTLGASEIKNMKKAGLIGSEPAYRQGADGPSISLRTGNVIETSPTDNKGKSVASSAATDKVLKEAQDRALAYAAGQQAIADYTSAAEGAKTAAEGRIANVYDPQATSIDEERKRQLALLELLIGQGQTDISKAEQDFLSSIQPTSAYSNVPLVNMEAVQNPLLDALRQQGAGEGAIQSQVALDKSLSDFMTQLQQQSAGRYGDVQQNYLEALKNAGRGAAASGLQYLAQRQPEISSGIESNFGKALADLATNRASSEADIMNQYYDALSKITELQAQNTSQYAPPSSLPEVPQAKVPTGESPFAAVKGAAPAGYHYTAAGQLVPNVGASKAGAGQPTAAQTASKPSTPAGAGLHWEWNGSKWVPVPNKK